MMNTLCTTCDFGVVRLEVSTKHFQQLLAFCMLMDKNVEAIVKCTGYQQYNNLDDVDDG